MIGRFYSAGIGCFSPTLTKASDVKATDATTIAPATYYVKCDHCGEVSSTITVAVGSPLPAEEPVEIPESEDKR